MQESSGIPYKTVNRLTAVDEVGFLASLLALEVSVETAGSGEGGAESARAVEEMRDLARRGADAAVARASVEAERSV